MAVWLASRVERVFYLPLGSAGGMIAERIDTNLITNAANKSCPNRLGVQIRDSANVSDSDRGYIGICENHISQNDLAYRSDSAKIGRMDLVKKLGQYYVLRNVNYIPPHLSTQQTGRATPS